MKYLRYAWRVLVSLLYLILVVAALATTRTRFETLVLGGLVRVFTAVLYNFSLIGMAIAASDHSSFVRFRKLAEAQGITGDQYGTFKDQETVSVETLKEHKTNRSIKNLAHAAVSICALIMMIIALFSAE
jgi:hypothetical protein